MPATLTYPGVYIEEIPSRVRTIVGVTTSITAFIGRALRGLSNEPVRIQSFGDFERAFGGLWELSPMSYAVQHFFLNGGIDAIIVRVHRNASKATLTLPAGGGALVLEAASEGEWGNNLRAIVDHTTKNSTDTNEFNLKIEELVPGSTTEVKAAEMFLNVSRDENSPRFIKTILEQESTLTRVQGNVPADRPNIATTAAAPNSGANGDAVQDAQITGSSNDKTGVFALEKADLFNLLCVPPLEREVDILPGTRDAVTAYCTKRRAIFIADGPRTWTGVNAIDTAETNVSTPANFMNRSKDAAAYFPRLKMQDPLKENRIMEFAPCGAVAGIIARTDTQRGVW